ncbi:protein root primordium defective 1 [Quercus suber]|uniref:Protein root primordium defective 1 n=1 Tax=Quercus suber TaxID=58331 RepID=A0AAW0LZM1_QUESU
MYTAPLISNSDVLIDISKAKRTPKIEKCSSSFYPKPPKAFKPKTPIPKTLQPLLSNVTPTRPMSQSTSIPKKLQHVHDHGYENYMEVKKKTHKV